MIYINFSYHSPDDDIEECIGYNPDGTINIKYTLSQLRELLQNNLTIVNNLLEKSSQINNIHPTEYGIIGIDISSEEVLDTLIKSETIKKIDIENESDSDDVWESESINNASDNEESNQDRLKAIKNITNQKDLCQEYDMSDSSDDNADTSENNIISDDDNIDKIVQAYKRLNKKNNLDSDDNSGSDEDDD